MAAIALELIDDVARLCAFEPQWLKLLEGVPPPTPFQSPRWLLTWWKYFGSGTLHTLVFRHRGEVAGVFPCFLHEWNACRQLTLIGSGLSDFLDPVFDWRHVPEILDALRSHLLERPDWDICDWQDLSSSTPLTALAHVTGETPCSCVALSGSFD